jgi:hypothetical protein
MVTLKITALGAASALILPYETLARLKVEVGDTRVLNEAAGGKIVDAIRCEMKRVMRGSSLGRVAAR